MELDHLLCPRHVSSYLLVTLHCPHSHTCHVWRVTCLLPCPSLTVQTRQWAVTQWAKCLSILTIKSVNKGSLPKLEIKCISRADSLMSLITTPQMLYCSLNKQLNTHFAAPSQRPILLYDMHTDARLVSVYSVYTLHGGAVSSARGALCTTGLGPGQGGGAETKRGPTTLLSHNLSHPTNLSNVPSYTPLSTWSTTVHLPSSSPLLVLLQGAQHN